MVGCVRSGRSCFHSWDKEPKLEEDCTTTVEEEEGQSSRAYMLGSPAAARTWTVESVCQAREVEIAAAAVTGSMLASVGAVA